VADGDKAAGKSAYGDNAFCHYTLAGLRASSISVMNKRQAKYSSVRFEFVKAGAVCVHISTPGAEICLFNFVFNIFQQQIIHSIFLPMFE
jgi:hypothetical protein